MKNKRRDFLRLSGLAGLSLAGGNFSNMLHAQSPPFQQPTNTMDNLSTAEENQTLIGLYGTWAAGLISKELPSHSFRRDTWKNVDKWRTAVRKLMMERMAVPDIGGMPEVQVNKQYSYDGLHIEELSWQLPYGRPTEAILLKPENATKPLPGILAFHDHGGNKYFGTRKITKTSDDQHPLIRSHQAHYYEGKAWANDLAKRGYVVLVSDAFTFASRRVMFQDVPEVIRQDHTDADPENEKNINTYNTWASDHEHIMAKSLFCAGTTWPGVFFAEDRKALDILCARKDVDTGRIGCGGLSGGGLRTVFAGGLDPRIKCAISVGFMTTWKDLILNKSFTHTWMCYVPLLPRELDFPEIFALRAPSPTLVLNNSEDFLFSAQEMKSSDKIMSGIFDKANAREHYKCSFYPGPHKFDNRMQVEAFDWFDRWLKV